MDEKKYSLLIIIFFSLYIPVFSQENIQWKDPQKEMHFRLQGQGWEGIGYHRLPDEAKDRVREPVWRLSRNSTGLVIPFSSDATSIKVRFIPQDRLEMPHMPATGVSGLDLYTKDKQGNWIWIKGNYAFGDTVSYEFILRGGEIGPREFHLYLPLYNTVTQLQLGIEEGSEIQFLSEKKGKPIVVYGTSIAQGACASRPGMAWPAILSRKLNMPVINLGFSGNGRLEEELIDYLTEIEAKLYILDCLPNLVATELSESELKERISRSVRVLKEKHPDIPILLVEHAGYSDGLADEIRGETVERVNRWCKDACRELLMEGIEEIYLLEKEDIALTMDATVDGTHPSDLGMEQYANAYHQIIEDILF